MFAIFPFKQNLYENQNLNVLNLPYYFLFMSRK